jgi:ApaG protein
VSDTTTNGIRVQVRSEFLADLSAPLEKHYFFAYHITISNVGSETAQLLTRHWVITDAVGRAEVVVGLVVL